MNQKNLLGSILVAFGSFSLIFGWPWGSLVGAILALAGVLALRLQSSVLSKLSPSTQSGKTSPQKQLESMMPFAQPDTLREDFDALVARAKEMNSKGEPVPEEMIERLREHSNRKHEEFFQHYDTVVSKYSSGIVELASFAEEVRNQFGFPLQGSVLGHAAASEEIDFVLTRIESFDGHVPVQEAMLMTALLKHGPERDYFKERQKRGFVSLFGNEGHLDIAPAN